MILAIEEHFGRDASIKALILTSASFVVISSYYYFRSIYKYWERKGIKGPRPSLLVGNIKSLLVHNRAKVEEEWVKKFGKIYGIYYGTVPRLVVADVEVLQQICIKDFDIFTDHMVSEFFNKYQKSFILFLKGDHWKKVRALMSPTFTSGKIRRMFRFLDACANDLIDCAKEQLIDGDHVILNTKDYYNLYTMDAIATCCYGLKLQREGTGNLKTMANRNEFVRIAMSLFKFNLPRLIAVATVPKAILRFFNFEVAPENNFKPLLSIVDRLIENRRKLSKDKKFDDYLQLLLDAKLDDQLELGDLDEEENHHAGLTQESLVEDQRKLIEQVQLRADKNSPIGTQRAQVKLSDLEIITGASFLLLVGLETTGNLLSNCTYILAFHQDVQEKLYQELRKIAEFLPDDKTHYSFNYDTLTSCRYLDAVLSESLRIMTPALTGDRIASEDYYIAKYNLTIPKGMIINLPWHAVMNDPDYWPEPEKFDPERFMPENKHKIIPGTYCPFGLGPRHCIGMRFSLTEAKLSLAKIMMNFRFEPAPGTQYPPESKLLSGVLNCLKDPNVKYVLRS